MTLSPDFKPNGRPLTEVELRATKLVNEWKESRPDEPWNVIQGLMVAVVEQYPDIVLLTDGQTRELMAICNMSLPPGKSLGDIAGLANPGIVNLRKPPKE
jgi:hypothetical protein